MNEQELYMSGGGTAAVPPQSAPEDEKPETEMLETRFGKVKISRKNPIVFPNGLLGIPDKFEYCLTEFPSEKLSQFRLLQSLDDKELSFITLPLEASNSIIDKDDILVGCRDLDIPEAELTLLLIVTVHRQTDGVRLSVNARAPIYVSTPRRVANQYVFHNNKYDIQHIITF